jgi:MFS family permease
MKVKSFNLEKHERKIVRLAALGGMLEFYDFVIYGIFSVYFAEQFFPSDNHLISVVKSYVIFVLGYIARPIGGVIFSHLGDEHGRKHVLIFTIILMGASSLGIGILPTYAQIGIAAPFLLLFLRLLQGLALGGELPSTYVYISESMPTKRGGAFGLTMVGVNSGLLLGMFSNQLLNFILSPEEISAYGWRIPFIFGGLLCIISYQIRKTLQETSAFIKIHDKPAFPFLYLLRHHFPQVLIGSAITGIMSALVVVTIVFMPTYLNEMLTINHKFIAYCMPVMMLFNVLAIYCTGRLANHINPRKILATLLCASFILVPCSYWLISYQQLSLLMGLVILGILEGVAAMLIPLIICDLFSAPIRLTGVALCYNVGFTIFGGLSPVIISTLLDSGHGVYITPVLYLLSIIIVSGLGLRFFTKSSLKINADQGPLSTKINRHLRPTCLLSRISCRLNNLRAQ